MSRLWIISLLLLLALPLSALDEKTRDRTSYLGNLWQLASFHLGSSIDLNTPSGGAMGLSLGASAGWNYLFLNDVDIGVRGRYLYSGSYASTHALGAILYVHSWNPPNEGLFSFALGGGMLITHTRESQTLGGYVEVGLAGFKFFPVNIDLLYRASFYPVGNALGMAEMVHGIQIISSFL